MKARSIIATCSLLLIQSLQNLHADAPTNGLIAYYPFDGNGNDASGNGRNLTINGCGFTNGIRGQALNFTNPTNWPSLANGSSAEYTTNPVAQFTNRFSFSVWWKPSALTTNFNQWMYILDGKSVWTNNDATAWLRFTANGSNRPIDFGYANRGTLGFLVHSTLPDSNLTWSHIVATAQGTNEVAVYVNGQLLNKYTNCPSFPFNQNNFYFGNSSGNQYPLSGQIDQIRLYNRALTRDEVLALYNLDHMKYVTLVLKSSSDLTSWQPAITNRIETYNPTEFYQTDITVSDTPPPQ